MLILKYRMLLLILLAGSIHMSVLGQLPGAVTAEIEKAMPKPIPPSPNVAVLGRFGTYAVSLYTGLPSISVPIYEIKSGELTVPVTLNYHASGFRVLDNAGWVGLGWALDAGGQISREQRGHPDEQSYWQDPLVEFPSICGPNANWGYIRDAENEISDTQPDIFSYSMNGKSGSFMLGHAGESPYLFPYNAIKLSHNGINSTGTFDLNSFSLTDTDGTIYRFGETLPGLPAKETTTVDRSPFLPSNTTTGWLLTEMRAGNSDDAISFRYQNLGYAITSEPRTTVTLLDNCDGPSCPPAGPDLVQYGTNRSTTSQLGLGEVVFAGGKLKFIKGASRLDQLNLAPLDRIEIYSEVSGTYTLVRTVKFHYSYFGYLTAPGTPVKLKLDRIEFRDSGGKVDNTYSFEYHTDGFSWNEGTAYSKDFWGFYNGKPNSDLIPRQTVEYRESNVVVQKSVVLGSADRSTVPTFMKEGVLSRINFPTGGYTEFDFEPHRYTEDNTTRIAAGLRVTKIKSYDGSGSAPVTKTYAYGNNESGAGVKNFYQDLMNYRSETFMHDICCLITRCGGPTVYRQRTFFGNSLVETGSGEGSAVVYPVVTEYYGDQTSNIGKIVYEYDNGQYQPDSLQVILGSRSARNFKSSFAWRRGKLTKKTVINKSGAPVNETVYTYTLFQRQKKFVGTAAERVRSYVTEYPCLGDCTNEFGEPVVLNEFKWTPYYQMSGALVQTGVIERNFEAGNPGRVMVSNSSITYDPVYLAPVAERQSGNTDSEEVVTFTRFPFSYTFTGSQTGTARAVQLLLEKNILTEPVEQYSVRRNTDGTNARVLGAELTIYRVNANNISQVVPDSVLVIESTAPVPLGDFTPSSIVNRSRLARSPLYRNGIRYLSFDGSGNINEVRKDNDYVATYLWGYRNELPVAEVLNAELDIQPETFIDLSYENGTSFTTAVTTSTLLPGSLTVPHQQVVFLHVDFYHNGATPVGSPVLDLIIKKSDGTVAFDPAAYPPGIHKSSFQLAAGTYNFYYTGNAYSPSTAALVTARFNITVDYQSKTSRNAKVFHTSFEESGISAGTARTGTRVHQGIFYVPLPTTAGKYWLTWWQKTGLGTWTEQKTLITAPYVINGVTQTTYAVGAGATYVDEVRLYPEKAFMSTYTYDPVLGMTSSTDRNNQTTWYSYDSMGRMKTVRDTDGKILTNHIYHYKR